MRRPSDSGSTCARGGRARLRRAFRAASRRVGRAGGAPAGGCAARAYAAVRYAGFARVRHRFLRLATQPTCATHRRLESGDVNDDWLRPEAWRRVRRRTLRVAVHRSRGCSAPGRSGLRKRRGSWIARLLRCIRIGAWRVAMRPVSTESRGAVEGAQVSYGRRCRTGAEVVRAPKSCRGRGGSLSHIRYSAGCRARLRSGGLARGPRIRWRRDGLPREASTPCPKETACIVLSRFRRSSLQR